MTRFLRSHAWYVTLTTGVLALAIGINVLVFSIVDALWFRPLPVFEPERVVTILNLRSTVRSLDATRLSMFDGPVAGQVVTTRLDEAFRPRVFFPQVPELLETLGVTSEYFSVLGVPVRGRAFTTADDRIGAEQVAVISDRLWARGFGRRADVLGSVIEATPRPLRVIGIAGPGFEGARRGERADLWVPTQVLQDWAPADRQSDTVSMMVFARLRPGQTIAGLEQQYRAQVLSPSVPLAPDAVPTLASLPDVFGTSDSPSILIRESGTVAVVSVLSLLVLLGGCATIATLVLTHYERRRTELAIKAALGAGRARIVRQLMTELLVVGLAGSLGAAVCGLFAARALPALSLPGGVNIGRLDLSVDWRICAMALVAMLVTLTVSGAVPLWQATHRRLAGEISSGPVTAGRGALRARRGLLSFQVCATTIVLIASALLVRTVLYSFRFAAGFDVERTVFVNVQEKSISTTAAVDEAFATGMARQAQMRSLIGQIPSVRAVAGGISPIGANARPRLRTITIAGHDEPAVVGVLGGTPNLLPTLGVPLLAGRVLESSDSVDSGPTAAVITRSLAERLWRQNPLGQTFSMLESSERYLVVGIAADFAFGTLARPVAGVIVVAKGHRNLAESNMVVQTDDPDWVAAAVVKQLPGRVVRVATGHEIIGRDISQQRLGAWVFSGFGLVALTLGVGGVFGLVAYLAQARRREFGLRMALGATLSDVVKYAVITALGPVVIGAGFGVLIATIATRVLSSLLVGIGRSDPGTYVSVGLAIVAPATLAALLAAWRLRGLAPFEALRRG